MSNRAHVPAVFRTNRHLRWDSKPWPDRSFLLHAHHSTQFLKGTPRECRGVKSDRMDWTELTALIVCGVGFLLLVVARWMI